MDRWRLLMFNIFGWPVVSVKQPFDAWVQRLVWRDFAGRRYVVVTSMAYLDKDGKFVDNEPCWCYEWVPYLGVVGVDRKLEVEITIKRIEALDLHVRELEAQIRKDPSLIYDIGKYHYHLLMMKYIPEAYKKATSHISSPSEPPAE